MCDQRNVISIHEDNIQNETVNKSLLNGTVSKKYRNYKLCKAVTYTPQKFNKAKELFACPFSGCNKAFTRKLRLNNHIKQHCGVQPYKCMFPGCFKTFSEKSNLKIHMRIHTNERPFKHTCWMFQDLQDKSKLQSPQTTTHS